jgi:hypothetical protein
VTGVTVASLEKEGQNHHIQYPPGFGNKPGVLVHLLNEEAEHKFFGRA